MSKRELRHLVLHCTATKQGVDVRPEHIISWHTTPTNKGGRGWSRVGYNKLFLLDGSIHEFYPENGDNFVDDDEIAFGIWGTDTFNCHHWVYAGGLDSAGHPRDTRTDAQKLSLADAIVKYIEYHPDIKIGGHHQHGVYVNGVLDKVKNNKACPSFWVPKWLKEIGIEDKNIYTADPFGYAKLF